MKTKLTEDQKRVASLLVKRRRAMVCEKAGKGKTLSVLASYLHLKEKGLVDKLVVLTPKNAYEKRVWESECKKHTHLKAVSLDQVKSIIGARSSESLQKYISNYDVIYAKHSHLRNSLDMLVMLRAGRTIVCIDEVHAFKNPQSKLTMLMSAWLKPAYAVWTLTATPMSKSMEDTFYIINLIKPGALGSIDWFRDTICSTEEVRVKTPYGMRKLKKINGVKDEQLFKSLVSGFVIEGIATIEPTFHKLEYTLSAEESSIYLKIARGIQMHKTESDKEWITKLFEAPSVEEHPATIKAIDVHSSRFIYLQYAADGIVNSQGEVVGAGSKLKKIKSLVEEITAKRESVIIYFDYYSSLNAMRDLLKQVKGIEVVESTGNHALTESEISEAKCKIKPYVVLMTRAGAPSVSFYYINNVIMAHIPTVPETFTQTVGRITRIDTLFPGNLNVYVLQSQNIDEYKMRLVTSKTEQMETVAGTEKNIPNWYRNQVWNEKSIKTYKRYFLWK